jgi:hypothetical protein
LCRRRRLRNNGYTCVCRLKHAYAPQSHGQVAKSSKVPYCEGHLTHSERNRGQLPRHHGQVPATHKERAAGNGLATTIKNLLQAAAANNRLDTTIKYLRGATGICLGTTFKRRSQCLSVDPELPPCVHKHNPHQHTFPSASAAHNNVPISKEKTSITLARPSLLAEPAPEGASNSLRFSSHAPRALRRTV